MHERQPEDRPLRRVLDDRHHRPSCLDLRQRELRRTPNWFVAHPMRLATKATPIPFATDPREYPEPLRYTCEAARTGSAHIRTPIRRIRVCSGVRPVRYIFDELLLLLVRHLPSELTRWYNVPSGRNNTAQAKELQVKYTLVVEPGATHRQVAAAAKLLATLAVQVPSEANPVTITVPSFQSKRVGGEHSAPALAFWLRDEDTSMGYSEEFWFGASTTEGTPVYSGEAGPDEPAFWLPEGWGAA